MRPRSDKTKRILDLNNQGMTVIEIADVTGIPKNVVRCAIWNAGEHANTRKKKLDFSEVRKMASSGKTNVEIAAIFGVSANVIHRSLKAMGIQTRRTAQRSSEPDCFNCPFPDCRWDSQAAKCPAQN